MGYVAPLFGPDAGRLVWRDADVTPAPPPDEAALDAALPGRAAIRELYRPGTEAADRARRGAEGAAAQLYREARRVGVDLSLTDARARVDRARAVTAARRGSE